MPRSVYTSVTDNKTKLDKTLVGEIYDAISKYRAAYHATPCKIGWWWHSSTKKNLNGWIAYSWSSTAFGDDEATTGNRYLALTASSGTPYIQSPVMNTILGIGSYPSIGSGGHRYLKLKYRCNRSFNLRLSWTTTTATSFDTNKKEDFGIIGDNTWRVIEFDLSTNAYWTGSLRSLRIGTASAFSASTTLNIAYITIDTEDYRMVSITKDTTDKVVFDKIRTGIDTIKGSSAGFTSYTANKDKITSALFAEIKTKMNAQEAINRGWTDKSDCDYSCSCDNSCDSYVEGCACDSYLCACDSQSPGYWDCTCDDNGDWISSLESPMVCGMYTWDYEVGQGLCSAYGYWCTGMDSPIDDCSCESGCDNYEAGCDPYNYYCWTCDLYTP